MVGAKGSDRSRETQRRLRAGITSGRWPLNSRIPTEAELMAEFGVGRSTVREAVQSLAAVGMLEPARSRGTFVRSLSPVSTVLSDFIDQHLPDDIIAVRRLLETEMTRLAATHRTDEHLARLTAAHEVDVAGGLEDKVDRGHTPGQFHGIVAEASGNSLLRELYGGLMHGLRELTASGEVVAGIDDAGRQADHQRILDAIIERDPDRAAQAAGDHAARDLIPAE